MSVTSGGPGASGGTRRATFSVNPDAEGYGADQPQTEALENRDDRARRILGLQVVSSNVSAEAYPVLELSDSGKSVRAGGTSKEVPDDDDSPVIWLYRNHMSGGGATSASESTAPQMMGFDLSFGGTGPIWDAHDELYLHYLYYASGTGDEKINVIVYWEYV